MSDEPPKLRLKPRLKAEPPAEAISAPEQNHAAASDSIEAIQFPAPSFDGPAEAGIPLNAANAPVTAGATVDPTAKSKLTLRPMLSSEIVPATGQDAAASGATPVTGFTAAPAALASTPGVLADGAHNAVGAAPVDTAPGVPAESVRHVKLAALIIGVLGLLVFVVVGTLAFPGLLSDAKTPAGDEEDWSESAAIVAEEEARNDPVGERTADDAAALSAVDATTGNANDRAPSVRPAAAPLPFAGTAEAWIRELRISGLRRGSSPRILIGGRSYAQGEIVNAELGVIFVAYDEPRRTLRFKDRTGRIIERPGR